MENACSLPATSGQSQLFDVGIICNDVCYGAHKFILAMQSTYLKKLFLRTAKETGNSPEAFRIIMDDIEEIDVINVLKYCYDGEVGITKEEVKGFLIAGKLLRLDPILELIQEDEDFRDLETESFQEKFNARVAAINMNNDDNNDRNNSISSSSDKVLQNVTNNVQNTMLKLTKIKEMAEENDDDVRIIDMVSGGKQRERKHKLVQAQADNREAVVGSSSRDARVPLPKRPRPSIVINRNSDASKTVITYTHSESGKLMEMKKKSPDTRFLKIEGDVSLNESLSSQSSSFNQGTLAFSGIDSFVDKSASNSNACWMLADTIDSLRPSQTPLTT